MNRKTYWLYVVAFLLFWFFVGVLTADLSQAEFGALQGFANLVSIPFVVWLGYQRCEDIGCSKWWSIAALPLIGLIILGLIPRNDKETDS